MTPPDYDELTPTVTAMNLMTIAELNAAAKALEERARAAFTP